MQAEQVHTQKDQELVELPELTHEDLELWLDLFPVEQDIISDLADCLELNSNTTTQVLALPHSQQAAMQQEQN